MSSSEAAAWVQAIGSVVAIVVAALIVWFQHSLQLRAEEARERRQLALEIEAIEMPLGEVLTILKAAQASTVDDLAYRSHGSDTSMHKHARRIEVAMGLLRGFIAGKPQWVMPFLLADGATQQAARVMRQGVETADGVFRVTSNLAEIREVLAEAVDTLEQFVRDLRSHREPLQREPS